MKKRVLLTGLAKESVDFEKWPELTPEKLEAAFVSIVEDLKAKGYEATWCLTDRGETAKEQFQKALRERKPDVVLIGAGVRKDPDHLYLFEVLINCVLEISPNSRIAFNTLPFDSVEAVERWV